MAVERDIAASWSTAQGNDIATLLDDGIRYFDLRICPNPEAGSTATWICHGLYAEPTTAALNAVRQFVATHPREIVVLDLSHMSDNHVTAAQNAALATAIVSTFTADRPGDLLVPTTISTTATLNQIWGTSGRVVVLSGDAATVANHQPYLWPGGGVPGARAQSPWPSTADAQTQLSRALSNLTCRCNARDGSGDPSQLFVLQTNPTPDGPMIGGSIIRQVETAVDAAFPWPVRDVIKDVLKAIVKKKGWPETGPNNLRDVGQSEASGIVPGIVRQATASPALLKNLNIISTNWYQLGTVVADAQRLNQLKAAPRLTAPTPTPVIPEPPVWVLFASGLAALAWFGARRPGSVSRRNRQRAEPASTDQRPG